MPGQATGKRVTPDSTAYCSDVTAVDKVSSVKRNIRAAHHQRICNLAFDGKVELRLSKAACLQCRETPPVPSDRSATVGEMVGRMR